MIERSPKSRILAVLAGLAIALAGVPQPGAAAPDTGAVVTAAAVAEPPAGTADEDADAPVDPASPRAALESFLELSRRGEHDDAARYLEELPDADPADRPALAQRLAAVLERTVGADLGTASPVASGDTDDGLPRHVDEVASVGAGGEGGSVLMRRAGGRWVFTAATLASVDTWYASLRSRWFLEHLPAPLLRVGVLGIAWWQWIGLLVLAPALLAASFPLARATSWAMSRLAHRTRGDWDEALVRHLAGPLRLGWTLVLAAITLPYLGMPAHARAVLAVGWRALAMVATFWALLRLVDLASSRLRRSGWTRHAGARAIAQLGTRLAKVVVLAMAAVGMLSLFGVPVASLVAGLGIGGIALALAAQKTVENLFGSISLAVDRPFAIGDFVDVEGTVGTIEAIGLRSTRVRTLQRTLVTIPNGKLADMRVESFAPRDKMRFEQTLPLVRTTPSAVVRSVVARVQDLLEAHARISDDAVQVKVARLAESSLEVEVACWFATPSWDEFLVIREDVLLRILDEVSASGAELAYPTRAQVRSGEVPDETTSAAPDVARPLLLKAGGAVEGGAGAGGGGAAHPSTS